MSTRPRILVVDDEPSMRNYIQTLLTVDSYNVETVSSGYDALRRLEQDPPPHLVLLDLLMPGMDGLQTLEKLRHVRPEQKVIMLTCVNEARIVVQALRLGAHDYLTKPFHKADLDAALKSCLSALSRPAEAPAPLSKAGELTSDGLLVATSAAMQKILGQVRQIANINVPVLLLGESGTGKEVVARLIHKMSNRASRTFLKVNCAALPGELLESELFGYEPGAFTGATQAKPGKFELCHKGTILLDEIGEMPLGLQAKLLHVLQDAEFSRLGSRTTVKVDVRVLAATNVDVQEAIAAKKLREDLYYRLNAITLYLPPLRERPEEIPLLLKHFMAMWADKYALPPQPLSPKLIEACTQYHWPGNAREVENFVKRCLILDDENMVLSELESLRERSAQRADLITTPSGESAPGDLKALVRDAKGETELAAIARALEQTNWNRKAAARLLNISYKALLYKIRQYGLDK